MKTFPAIVVGLGKIGQGFDYDSTSDSVAPGHARVKVLTHAKAFRLHSGFELFAGVDPDPDARARFERKFSLKAYATLAEVPGVPERAVISLSGPTATRASMFREALAYRPAAILCEKPLGTNVAEAEAMIRAADAAGCPVLVNYVRRFEPGVRELKVRIERKEYGEIAKGVAWYTRGFLNNASHFIDLALFLFGPLRDFAVLKEGDEPDVRMRFGNTELYLLASRAGYSLLEMTLVGSNGSIQYCEGGSEILGFRAEADPFFEGFVTLSRQPEKIAAELDRYQWHVTEALYQHLSNGQPLASNGATALETLKATLAVLERQE